MSSIDPTKRTFGITDPEGLWLLCCDCPEEYEACQCLSSALLYGPLATGKTLSNGTWAYMDIVDEQLWALRGTDQGKTDYHLTSSTVGGLWNEGDPISGSLYYHDPDPTFLAAYVGGVSPDQTRASNTPEIIDGGVMVSQALRDALYPSDPDACHAWNYLVAGCSGPNPNGGSGIPGPSCSTANSWNDPYVLLDYVYIPDPAAIQQNKQSSDFTKYNTEYDQFGGGYENSSYSKLTSGSIATQHSPAYATGGGCGIRQPGTSSSIPSGLPLWTPSATDMLSGYTHSCPEPPEAPTATEVYGHYTRTHTIAGDGPLPHPRLARITWGGHDVYVKCSGSQPVYGKSVAWRAQWGTRIYNGWEASDYGQGGAMDQQYYDAVSGGSQDYALGGVLPGQPFFENGPASWDATAFQGNPVFDQNFFWYDFLPARPLAGATSVRAYVYEDYDEQNNRQWYGALQVPVLQAGESEYLNVNQTNPSYPNNYPQRTELFFNYWSPVGGLGGTPPRLPDEELSWEFGFGSEGSTFFTNILVDPVTGGSGSIPYYRAVYNYNSQVISSFSKHYLDWSVDWIF